MKTIEYVLLLLPLVTGFATSAFCTIGSDSGSGVKFRPPSWVFSIAWPILYLLLGYAWVVSRRNDSKSDYLYGALTLLLVLWIIVYGCANKRKDAVYILLLSIIAIIACFANSPTKSKLLLSPLFGWLLFALLMNTTEIQS